MGPSSETSKHDHEAPFFSQSYMWQVEKLALANIKNEAGF